MKRVLAGIVVLTVWTATVWAADGAAIYDKKCKACHSIAGVGGPMAKTGGPLDGVGAKRGEAWLQEYFKDPKSKLKSTEFSDE